ncbi:MAG TPA: tRNA (adenosine(37)-N6)-dimethylallyltransferase MiaA [bacterium]|nr:tRNA (adenosine(37)-N6)-dimethylallyltransferase MiaA [bacterium]
MEGRLVVIAGPTATGKTRAALAVARRIGAEIVCADSRTIYRGMDIGTAKPSPAERAQVPHHLLDVADPADTFTLADYQRLAGEAIAGIHGRGRPAVLTGGTGLYIRATVDRVNVPAVAPDWDLRDRLAAEERDGGPGTLHRKLGAVDPEAAERIDPRNVRRVIRALEVWEATGAPLSSFHGQVRRGRWVPPDPARSGQAARMVAFATDRERLRARIDRRIDDQLHAGLVEEVRTLLRAGCERGHPSMQGLGYKEIAAYLGGETTLDEAVLQLRRNTYRYAKRQMTWFRADPRYRWIDVNGLPPDSVAAAVLETLGRVL